LVWFAADMTLSAKDEVNPKPYTKDDGDDQVLSLGRLVAQDLKSTKAQDMCLFLIRSALDHLPV
jgi:hypothetical protein